MFDVFAGRIPVNHLDNVVHLNLAACLRGADRPALRFRGLVTTHRLSSSLSHPPAPPPPSSPLLLPPSSSILLHPHLERVRQRVSKHIFRTRKDQPERTAHQNFGIQSAHNTFHFQSALRTGAVLKLPDLSRSTGRKTLDRDITVSDSLELYSNP